MPSDAQKKKLLNLLADNAFHSGTELAAALGVSRTAVWKAVRELESAGLEIAAVPGRGYRVVRPLELLDEGFIRGALTPEALAVLAQLHIHDQLDSTNSHLMRLAAAAAPAGTVCLADTQTAGRGRIGRTWLSPLGANVHLSVLWRFDDHSRIAGLSLAIGVAVVRALGRAGIREVGLKWPNDLLWRDRKLGGILIEAAGEAHGRCAVVVGLGVNRYVPATLAGDIDQPWTDLQQLAGTALPGRNILIALILNELLPLLRDYHRQGLDAYLPDWRRHHCLAGREVAVCQGSAEIEGRVEDVTAAGLLVLRCEDGKLREFASGDVRLRLNPVSS
jgi:BirA family biotin operon repressor/biotin-[acetyl-CoA-carboxylase] ligase